MHPLLQKTAHRPWPVPARVWIGRQTWRDLLFAHYRVPAAVLRSLVPPPLRLQEEDGMAWLGVVPFRMTGVMARGLPALPWLSAFPELNVRLYVEYEGKPGVWFLSLDATNPVAVWTAKRFFNLPYRLARIDTERDSALGNEPDGAEYRFSSELVRGPSKARFVARYRPNGVVYAAAVGTEEQALTERYCFYAVADSGRLYRTEVHHLQWPLQHATAEIDASDLLASHRIELAGPPELLHFAKRVDVLTWAPEAIGGGA
jgi:uncharacterized protein